MDPVIIVGAGPVGLALSLSLARYEVPTLVLDATDGETTPRAARTCVLRADTAAALPPLPGTRWTGWRAQRRNQTVRHIALDTDTSPVHVEQHVLERTLRTAVDEEPLAEIVTGSHVDLVEQDAHGVTAHTRGHLADATAGPSGARKGGAWRRGSYLVGCDGARSTVRKLLGVRFTGRTAVERHAVAALRTQLPWPGQALLHRDLGDETGEVTARPLPDGVWRLDWLLPPRGDLVTPDQLLDRIRTTLTDWHETYGGQGAYELRPGDPGSDILGRPEGPDGTRRPGRHGRGLGELEGFERPGGLLKSGTPGGVGGPGTPAAITGPEPATEPEPEAAGTVRGFGRFQPRGRGRRPDNATPHPPYELLDTGVHTCHQRLAQRWRVGRAFLAGDAAHLLGALGVQSVDEGLRDVRNLSWKLALAWHSGAGNRNRPHVIGEGGPTGQDPTEALLDSYTAERRGAVVARLRAVDQALPVVRRNGGGLRALLPSGGARARLGLLTDTHLGLGALGAPADYPRSPLLPPRGTVESVPVDTEPGAVVHDVPVTTLHGEQCSLHQRFHGTGGELLVVLVAPGTGVWDSRHWLSAGMMPQLAATVDGLPLRAELLVAESYPGAAAHTLLVIRADGHLVAALPGVRTDELRACAEVARGAGHTPVGGGGGRG
ncbi:FAD-dependent monooxygenase [Streptomyces sp. HNM0574]|uniref:FAD-dependent monooxygenase n=1 Tax=Streptomyces sp. HNM0574 TaxID=2714954 RepID=UPI00146CE161|nr:monooxygenase [Streptomyces sp. HNM0574]